MFCGLSIEIVCMISGGPATVELNVETKENHGSNIDTWRPALSHKCCFIVRLHGIMIIQTVGIAPKILKVVA